MSQITYDFDPTGLSPDNLIANEIHTLTEVNASTYRILVPYFAPFYLDNLLVTHVNSLGEEVVLDRGYHYHECLMYLGASRSIGKMIYGGLTINDDIRQGTIKLTYQTLGGEWIADAAYVLERLAEMAYNPRTTVWDVVTNKPSCFPPINHSHDADDFAGHTEILAAINALAETIAQGHIATTPFIKHILNEQNPHEVKREQLQLGGSFFTKAGLMYLARNIK